MTDRSTEDIYNAVLDVKSNVLDVKQDVLDLTQHVNHEITLLSDRIDGKLDNDQLLKSLGFKLLNNKFMRWSVGVVAAWAVGTLAWTQGEGPVAAVARVILRALESLNG